jgi:hypothetical protein
MLPEANRKRCVWRSHLVMNQMNRRGPSAATIPVGLVRSLSGPAELCEYGIDTPLALLGYVRNYKLLAALVLNILQADD